MNRTLVIALAGGAVLVGGAVWLAKAGQAAQAAGQCDGEAAWGDTSIYGVKPAWACKFVESAVGKKVLGGMQWFTERTVGQLGKGVWDLGASGGRLFSDLFGGDLHENVQRDDDPWPTNTYSPRPRNPYGPNT